ncbi:MAG: sigma-70 family RNA polymerase sigma factor [Planctomycetota bacterium]
MHRQPDPRTEDLFQQASAGDRTALDDLLEQYLPQLHAFVRARLGPGLRLREASVDVVQSVCRQILGARDDFDFHGEERFRAWLFTSALNKLREKVRHHQREMRDPTREEVAVEEAQSAAIASMLTPSHEAIAAETTAALNESLAALSEEHREVIALARVVGLPHRVIGDVLGRSEEATRQLLGRALLRLARELRVRGVRLADEP